MKKIIAYILCKVNFATLWTYVGIGNQFLATITLWTCATYFATVGKSHWLMSIPATFLSFICVCFFLIAPVKEGGMNLEPTVGYIAGLTAAFILLGIFIRFTNKMRSNAIVK